MSLHDVPELAASMPLDDLASLLAAAVGHSRTACCVTDANLDAPGPTILFANPAYCAMVGRSLPEILGRSPRMLQGPLSNRAELDRLRRELAAGAPFEGETINYRKDGSPFVISWDVVAVCAPDGTPRFYIASQQDVTELRQAETLIDAERMLSRTGDELISAGALPHEASALWAEAVCDAARRFAPGCDATVVLDTNLDAPGLVVTPERLAALVEHGDSAAVHTASGPVFLASFASSGISGAVVWHTMGADAFALLHQGHAAHFARVAGAVLSRVQASLPATIRDVLDTDSDPVAVAFRAYAKHPSALLRNILIEAHLPLAERLARSATTLDDAVSIAALELIRCVERFDPYRNVPFGAFATVAIQAELRHAAEAARWPAHVARQPRRDLARVLQAEAELTMLLARSPSAAEIAEHTSLELSQVLAARVLAASFADRPVMEELESPAPGDFTEELAVRAAFDVLDAHERRLATLRFDDGLSQREIASLLGISQARVSRSLERVSAKLLAELSRQL